MAYATEAMPAGPAIPNPAQLPMREERVLDPYRARQIKAPTPPPQAKPREQTDIDALASAEDPAPPAESVRLSPAAAALARKEQAFRQQQQELKAKEAALEAERAEIAELKAIKAKLASGDYSAAESLVPYDRYTNYLIEKDAGLSPEQQEFKKLQSEIEAVKKAQQDDVSKRFDAAVNERRKAVTELVEANESFSSIKELKVQDAVVHHILDTWEYDNDDLSVEQAAKEVEDYLIERGRKWASLSKLKPKQDPADERHELPPLKTGVKTLTNNMSATGEIKRPVKSFQGMSDAERYAEARRRAEEKLRLRG